MSLTRPRRPAAGPELDQRRRWLAHMLALAGHSYPDASWQELVGYACQIGAGYYDRARPVPAEYRTLAGMTLGQLYGKRGA
jgi:hypothetical protein